MWLAGTPPQRFLSRFVVSQELVELEIMAIPRSNEVYGGDGAVASRPVDRRAPRLPHQRAECQGRAEIMQHP